MVFHILCLKEIKNYTDEFAEDVSELQMHIEIECKTKKVSLFCP